MLYSYLVDKNDEQNEIKADSGEKTELKIQVSDTLATIKTLIVQQLKHVLRLEDEGIEEGSNFRDFGLDSIAGIQLATSLGHVLGMEIPPLWLIENSTVEALAGKIVETRMPR